MVSQVLVVGILMIVNGILSLLMGLLLAVMGPLMSSLFDQAANQQGAPALPAEARGMIYGLIVLFQADVAHAFELGASGYTADEIRQRMAGGARYPDESRRRQAFREEKTAQTESLTPPAPPATGPEDQRFFEK